MENVPKDVTIEMMLQLDAKSILNLCKTSTKFASICALPLFWKRKVERDYPKLNIDNVTEYKNLYLYLKKKPTFPLNNNNPQPGDLSENGKGVFGAGGRYYPIEIGTSANSGITFLNSRITFPSFPPEYFSQFNTNIFSVNYPKVREIAENTIKDVSFVTGPFGEKYTVIFRTDNISPESFNEIIKDMTNEVGSEFFRFVNGMFYKDMNDSANTLL